MKPACAITALVCVALLCALMHARTAEAVDTLIPGDTFIVHDLTDTLSVTGTQADGSASTRLLLSSCVVLSTEELCNIVIAPPSGFSPPTDLPGSVFIREPGTNNVSDAFLIQSVICPNAPGCVGYEFVSDLDPGFGPCQPSGFGECTITENGQVQLAFNINWTSPGFVTRDRVMFESDISEFTGVPEPSSMLVLLSGLGGAVGWAARRRQQHATD